MTTPQGGMCISIDFSDVDPASASIPVLDHGFLFGDSVYEVVRTWKGKLLFAPEHLARLRLSAGGINLPLPHSNAVFTAEMSRLHRQSGWPESYVRLIVTRGVGDLELATQTCTEQRCIFIARPLKVWDAHYYEKGGKLSLVSVVRNSRRATNPAFKTGNYLNNILAIEEARRAQATEAVMLNSAGHVTECTTSNVFIVDDGKVITPPLDEGILSGITRAMVIELCGELGMACHEKAFGPDAMTGADEVFITSTTRDVMPIARIDETVIGKGKPGPVTRALMKAYDQLCDRAVAAEPHATTR
jgi:branched-chain amino acid aminotransferase